MHISIDMNAMRFLHKHESSACVNNLDFIAHKECSLGPVDDPSLFTHFTDQELALLYKNVTGSTNVPAITNSLRMLLADMTLRFPVTDADPAEADAQAEWCERKHPDGVAGYVYVRGASVPRRTDDKLFPAPIAAATAAEVTAAVQKHTARAVQRAQQRASAVVATSATPSERAAPAQRKAAAAPSRKGVCGDIWKALDAELAATGAAPSRARVKELAAQHGWNPNTASVQSGAWRKAKSLP